MERSSWHGTHTPGLAPPFLAINGSGSEEGVHELVSQLLEGESLRQRLSDGPLPLRKVVDTGVQLKKGLSAAHEKGNMHRDLKPDHIFITGDGRVKNSGLRLGLRDSSPTCHTGRARWHRPIHCVSIRGGQDASASRPDRRTGQGYFFDCPSPRRVAEYLLERCSGTRVLHGANFVEVSFRRAARGHALLPQQITHSGAGPRLPLTGFRVCSTNPEIANVSGFPGLF